MAESPGQSLPQQMEDWASLKGAYRLLSNKHIEPRAIGEAHRQQTYEQCAEHSVVLLVQDGTDFQAVKVEGDRYVQHSTLAVTERGATLGLVDQRWYERVDPPANETRRERAARWRESCVWSDAARAVGPAPEGTRFIHVADRAADDLPFMATCEAQGHGFIIRAQYDRRLKDGTGKLWHTLQHQPEAGSMTVEVGTQRQKNGRIVKRGRKATVSVRYGQVTLDRPWSSTNDTPPRTVNAVYLQEIDPPEDAEPIDWMLLTSEPVASFEDACRIIGYYQKRWVVEEWHGCLKEGCKLEASQVREVRALQRLGAIQSILAVRLLQLRDAADPEHAGDQADDPKVLQSQLPWLWICLVACWRNCAPEKLTPRQFHRAIAKRGGWPGRNNDPRPGWKVLWRGFHELQKQAEGAELFQKSPPPTQCG